MSNNPAFPDDQGWLAPHNYERPDWSYETPCPGPQGIGQVSTHLLEPARARDGSKALDLVFPMLSGLHGDRTAPLGRRKRGT